MTRKNFDFIGKRKLFLCIAAAILVAGLIVNVFLSTELDINFKGGAIFTYSLSGDVDREGITQIANDYLGEDVDVSFSSDVTGENPQVTFTLVKVPSTVLTYTVTAKSDETQAAPVPDEIAQIAQEIFQCETAVTYDQETATLTVDPSGTVTDSMVSDLTAKLGEQELAAYTLTSSNTVSELAAAMLADMVEQYGTKLVYTATADAIDAAEATAAIEDALLADVTVTFDADAKTLTVVPASASLALTADNAKTITDALGQTFADAGLTLSSETYNAITLVTSNSVKPTVGKGFFIKCLVAMVLGGIFLTLYIGIRFRKIGGVSAALFATFALIHDILIAYLVYVVFRIPLDDNFIAVVLTILGYSINGTIVIYDRIRENERKFGSSLTLNETVNRSVNETITRNVFTSLSTFIAIVAIAVVAKLNGLDSIISFAFPMAVGIVAGFYSSVLLSSPLWAWWRTRKLAKADKK